MRTAKDFVCCLIISLGMVALFLLLIVPEARDFADMLVEGLNR